MQGPLCMSPLSFSFFFTVIFLGGKGSLSQKEKCMESFSCSCQIQIQLPEKVSVLKN